MTLWLKSFHLIFMVCWFAGIFYLPRIFVYIASTANKETQATLLIMARKLFFFITPFALLTIALGIALMSQNTAVYLSSFWFLCKIFCVVLLIIYHTSCYYLLRKLERNASSYSSFFFRVYNELPVFLLFTIIILVVVKPN